MVNKIFSPVECPSIAEVVSLPYTYIDAGVMSRLFGVYSREQ